MPQLSDIARDLADAWRSATAIDPPSSSSLISPDDAYEVQSLLAETLDLGERRGWKLGLTGMTAADGPMCGAIFERMVVPDRGSMSLTGLIHPRIEVEVGIAFDVPVPKGATRDMITSLPTRIAASFEIIDDRTNQDSLLVDWIADLATMARVAFGRLQSTGGRDLASLSASLFSDQERVASGRAEDIIGDPLSHVAWLSCFLAERDEQLEAGDVVITGSLTGQHSLTPGVTYRGEVLGLPPVEISTER